MLALLGTRHILHVSRIRVKDWPMQENPVAGEKCFRNRPQGEKDKILSPSLGIKLGMTKNFLEVMSKYCKDLEYLKEMFPEFSDAKLI